MFIVFIAYLLKCIIDNDFSFIYLYLTYSLKKKYTFGWRWFTARNLQLHIASTNNLLAKRVHIRTCNNLLLVYELMVLNRDIIFSLLYGWHSASYICKKSKALYKGDIMINFIKNKIISLFLNMIFYYVKYHRLINLIIKVISTIMDYLFR